jgi:hypothetical protein
MLKTQRLAVERLAADIGGQNRLVITKEERAVTSSILNTKADSSTEKIESLTL